jgi:hypothetical protein
MREAGFGDDEIDRWEKNASNKLESVEGDIKDVKWRRKGEVREWDEGKVGVT